MILSVITDKISDFENLSVISDKIPFPYCVSVIKMLYFLYDGKEALLS